MACFYMDERSRIDDEVKGSKAFNYDVLVKRRLIVQIWRGKLSSEVEVQKREMGVASDSAVVLRQPSR